jgi:hypothetical protein
VVLGRVALAGAGSCLGSTAATADFGGQMLLTSYTLADDRLTLCWSAEAAMPVDFTVFVHVVAADGQVVGSGDGQPRGGLFPTSAWAVGDVITDEHRLTLPAGARVLVGVYRLDTGERLPLAGSGDTELKLTRRVDGIKAFGIKPQSPL